MRSGVVLHEWYLQKGCYASGVSSEGLLSIHDTINNIAMLIDSQLGMAVLRKHVIFHVTICR